MTGKNVTKNKKNCIECNVLFQPNSNSQIICSEACKNLRAKRIYKRSSCNLTCAECSKKFTSLYKTTKFCSHECVVANKKPKPNVHCSCCGKHFHLKPSRVKRVQSPACSKKCNKELKKTKGWEDYLLLNDMCVVCGGLKSLKYGYSMAKKNKTCSDVCKYIYKTTKPENYKNVFFKFKDAEYKEFHRYVHKKIRNLRKRAKDKKIDFNIDTEYLIAIYPPNKKCPVLNIPFLKNIAPAINKDFAPSIDRIDNNKGYTKDNVCWMSYRANRFKNEMTFMEIKRLYEFMSNCQVEKNFPEMFGVMHIGKPFNEFL